MTDVPTTPNEGDRTTEQDNEEFEALRRTDSNDLTDPADIPDCTDHEPVEVSTVSAEDLGKHYADVQSQPINLTPEDEEKVAELLDRPTGLIEGSGRLGERKQFDRNGEVTPEVPDRPAFILSEVDTNHPSGRGLVLGWDTCGECHQHIRRCQCVNGPHRPRYVETWHQKNEEANQRIAERKAELAARAAKVEADPAEVELRVREVLEVTPTGRKKRSDAGKPRGPRKKADATPKTVLEAAGDLSQAMKDS